ncbi:hypothetical protein E2C01_081042 [Portunus trituberculatus]|uniref:Uncharacterized protein n=1 Tax=Portunus trituberculatus TaxID=210409 RepID=A0A5B7IQX2_PORTR|nr:hypothetical protein [Portunus trituberculatus]
MSDIITDLAPQYNLIVWYHFLLIRYFWHYSAYEHIIRLQNEALHLPGCCAIDSLATAIDKLTIVVSLVPLRIDVSAS